MRCMDCPAGKRITSLRIECILYGMILLEDHECTREGWKTYERDESDGEVIRKETELQEDCSGTA